MGRQWPTDSDRDENPNDHQAGFSKHRMPSLKVQVKRSKEGYAAKLRRAYPGVEKPRLRP
jgi:hypothetical protein